MGYGRFMAIGVERQRDSVTVDEATRNYARSCECCMKQGRNFQFDCDCDCPITVAHREKLEAILTLRQLEHERKMRKEREMREQQEREMKEREELAKKLNVIVQMVEDIYEMMYTPRHLDDYNDELDELVNKWINLKGGGAL